MAQKLMVDSCVLWAKQYRVDGFRFDLMGHHSKANMLAVRAALDALTPAVDGVDGYVFAGCDALDVLRALPDQSVNCCVTSPPYFCLRSYLPDGVVLRDDLTDDERAYVLGELDRLGIG